MHGNTKLSGEVLVQLGFVPSGENFARRPRYHKAPQGYPFHIEVVLGPYPDTNPNSGIVSVYSPAGVAYGIPDDLVSKESWTPEDEIRAENHTVPFDEMWQPVAWHVTRVGRLRAIYSALVGQELRVIPL